MIARGRFSLELRVGSRLLELRLAVEANLLRRLRSKCTGMIVNFLAKVPNDLTPASFHPVVLFSGSRGAGEKIQTGTLREAGCDLRVTVPFSSSANWVWFLNREELCVCRAKLDYVH